MQCGAEVCGENVVLMELRSEIRPTALRFSEQLQDLVVESPTDTVTNPVDPLSCKRIVPPPDDTST